jgi:hypothetical protein
VEVEVGFQDQVAIGDVGFVSDGFFHRMFNVTLPWDDSSNRRHGVPPQRYEPLDIGPIRKAILTKGRHYSLNVQPHSNSHKKSAQTSVEWVTALSLIDDGVS